MVKQWLPFFGIIGFLNLINFHRTISLKCPTDSMDVDGVTVVWKEINVVTDHRIFNMSNPICFTENGNIVYRECLPIGEWEQKSNLKCDFTIEHRRRCPLEFDEILIGKKSICTKLIEPNKFNETSCYGSDTTIFDLKRIERMKLFEFYSNTHQFWIPAKRYNGPYTPVVWRLPGNMWGEILSEKNTDYDETSVNECVSASVINNSNNNNNNNEINLMMTNCEDNLPTICIFKKDLLLDLNCPKNYFAFRYEPNKCYGIKKVVDLLNINFQNFKDMRNKNIFRLLAKKFDLDKKDMCLVHQENWYQTPIVTNCKGSLIPSDSYNCIIDNVNIVPYQSSDDTIRMFLTFHVAKNSLTLTVYNRDAIWRDNDDDDNYGIKCFTNADYEQLHEVKIKKLLWEDTSIEKSIFQLKLYGDGPGYYWCEAFSVNNFEFIKASEIVATKTHKGHPYAIYFYVPCHDDGCYRIEDNMKTYGKTIERILDNIKDRRDVRRKFKDMKIHNVRVMSIKEIIPKEKLLVLCHVTLSLKGSKIDDESEQESDSDEEDINGIQLDISVRLTLRNLLKDLIKLSTFKYGNQVNSTEFCFPEEDIIIGRRWQESKIGSLATTYEICLESNGMPISRKCEGDFLNGAIWARSLYKSSCISSLSSKEYITPSLYRIHQSKEAKFHPLQTLIDIRNIITKTINIVPADLFYLGGIMQKISQNILQFKLNNIINTNTQLTTATASSSSSSSSPSSRTNSIANRTNDVMSIYTRLMNVKENITMPSAKLNSTNTLLDAFENIINDMLTNININDNNTDNDNKCDESNKLDTIIIPPSLSSSSSSIDEQRYNQNGVNFYITDKIMIFAIDPSLCNISGVALYNFDNNSDTSSNFINYSFRFLYSDQVKEDLLEEDGLEIATFVPQTLLDRLDEIVNLEYKNIDNNITDNITSTTFEPSITLPPVPPPPTPPPPKIVIKFYYNDRFFQEYRNFTDRKVIGRILSVSIPGYGPDLPELLPIYLTSKSNGTTNDSEVCNYWNYQTWADDGLKFMNRSSYDYDRIMCGCSHLTPFAYLVTGSYNLSVSSDNVIITKLDVDALDIITILGCSLSLIGIFGIVITAIAFQTWREKAGSKVLLQLSAAIAFQMILFCFVNTDVITTRLLENDSETICIILGACLHYSVLVQFSWMLIIAYLQYKRYVTVLGDSKPQRFFIKAFILGWCMPLIPVLLIVFLKRDSYIPDEGLTFAKICYPKGQELYLGVILPISLIITANLVIFIAVLYNIFRGANGKVRKVEKQMALSQIRLSLLLFFLLGFTWIFGLLAASNAGLVFSYLFCLTATLQGFIIFVYFVILDPVTRKLWSNFLKRIFCKKHAK